MRNTILIVLAIATAVLGGLCVVLSLRLESESRRHQEVEAALRAENVAREQEVARASESAARAARFEREVRELTEVTSNLRRKESVQSSNFTALAQRMKASLTNSDGGPQDGGGETGGVFGKEMGNMLATMMKDPEMRKMIRGQQRAAVDMMYGGLFRQMRMTPEEKSQFTELLLDAQMSQVENSQALLGGGGGGGGDAATDPARARETLEKARQESDDQIRALLGEERFAEYKDYGKHIGERMQLHQFQSRLETASLPLQEPQVAQLLQLMQEEQARVPPVFPSDSQANAADMKSLMTAENLEKQLLWMDDYNKRMLERAATVLTPEQVRVYREFQEEQAAMQKLGLKMAQGMFGGKTSGPGSSPGAGTTPTGQK